MLDTPPVPAAPGHSPDAAPAPKSLPGPLPQATFLQALRGSWWQTALLVGMAALLAIDRFQLCTQFLFKYSDEDQTLLWYAAKQTLQGHFPEPCFYGQAYNSCMEGILAAPLMLVHVPPWIAVPLVAVMLGLLPFLLMAAMAWRQKRFWLAGLSLLVPLILPLRYAMLAAGGDGGEGAGGAAGGGADEAVGGECEVERGGAVSG